MGKVSVFCKRSAWPKHDSQMINRLNLFAGIVRPEIKWI